MQSKGKDSPRASDAARGPQREDAARVAWAGQGPGTLSGLLDRPTSCPPRARSPDARPCSPRVGGPRGKPAQNGQPGRACRGPHPAMEAAKPRAGAPVPIPLNALL